MQRHRRIAGNDAVFQDWPFPCVEGRPFPCVVSEW
ncbi:MAG: hypothetical protein RLY70_2385 [Planctomycetota bacterium]